jgi:hypothetical protein
MITSRNDIKASCTMPIGGKIPVKHCLYHASIRRKNIKAKRIIKKNHGHNVQPTQLELKPFINKPHTADSK